MRLPHHLLRHASGLYHFRLIVPQDLHGAVGLRVIKRSLRTRDSRLAMVAAWSLSASYARAFTHLRERMMAKTEPPAVEDIVGGFAAGTNRPYVIDRKKGIFKVDSPEDHAMAMDMLAAQERLVRAETEAALRKEAAADREKPDPQAEANYEHLQVVTTRTKRSGFTVRDMITHWETVEMPDMLAETGETRKKVLNDFAEHFGEKRPIADVRKTDVASWDAAHAKRGNTKSTRKGKTSHLKMFFDLADRSGHYPGQVLGNPADKVVKFTKSDKSSRAETHGWRAFTLPELQLLFRPENLRRTREPHTRRALVIGLYTGARVGEVAQLTVKDFTTEKGVKCIRFQGQLKTTVSKRLIPIHPDLLALGLWDWYEEQKTRKEERLFPTVSLTGKSGKGNAISKGTSNLLDLLNIKVAEDETTRIGYHSFRSTVIQQLQTVDPRRLLEERRRAYVGHAPYEKRDTSSHAVNYMRAWKPEEIEGLHSGITWGEWLDLPALKTLLTQRESDAELKKQARQAKRDTATKSA